MGSFANSVSLDYRITDDTESVVFVSKAAPTAGASDVTLTLTFVDFHQYTAKEIRASEGTLTAKDRGCTLPYDQLNKAGVIPKDGDRVQRTADGTNWRLTEPITLDPWHISYVVNLSQEK